ncbi:MAG: hypothetical protein EON60_08240 [Alphaproteobacteria bacterium]|nr:MAG: hypothetical protein EON60_08240 [Alphaproteobacteria bacterium]
MNAKLLSITVALVAATALSGCQSRGSAFPGFTSKAPARTVIAQTAEIKSLRPVLSCVRPAMAGKRIAITSATDNTGKGNSVSDAGTGNFLPGAQTGNFAIPTLQAAGATVVSLNNVSGESVLRQLVNARKLQQMQNTTSAKMPDMYLDFSSMTLDFDRSTSFALMIKGIGPYADTQRATISGGAKLVKADGSLEVAGYGGMKLSVFSTQTGIMLGRVFGNTLATGEAGNSFQQPMQLWTGEYITQLTTAMAMTDMPGARHCKSMINKIVQPDVVDM